MQESKFIFYFFLDSFSLDYILYLNKRILFCYTYYNNKTSRVMFQLRVSSSLMYV
jgi:hypothetical protein